MCNNLFDLRDQVAVLTGGGGVLVSSMAIALAQYGAKVAVATRSNASAKPVVDAITAGGGTAMHVQMDVTKREDVEAAINRIGSTWGKIDVLVNGAGGNDKNATTSPEQCFFDIPEAALRSVIDLNLLGTIIPCQITGRIMAAQKYGSIINISSMSSFRPLTRVAGYSAGKAAVNNFTQWLAVHMAQEYDPAIRVNAIAPGFFESEQNRFLLRDATNGQLSVRGQRIINHTPAGRFGTPADLQGTLVWLASPASSYVTGIVVPVDGGFSAYSGV